MEKGWVKVYEYDTGFFMLWTLMHTKPNEKNYDDKYTMGVCRIKKENLSREALTIDGAMKIIKYINFFTPSKNDFTKKLIKNKI